MKENDFLKWIADKTPGHARVEVGIGDDMAVVRVGGEMRNAECGMRNKAGEGLDSGQGPVLLKIDQALDRVHFDLREHTAAQAGRKAVNRCLSDCAAMACVPAAIMISVALPREGAGAGEDFAEALFLACRDAAAVFDCPLVGGDTAIWDQRLAITVAAMGELPVGGRQVLRSGAKVGDTLFVSGALGGSILGRHLSFEPRIVLAKSLAKALGPNLHAMMDLSDGLAQDLPRMCAASGVGAEVHAARLPVHADAERLSASDGIPAGLHALADGEDYELLFAVETEAIPELIALSQHGPVPLTAIGTVTLGGELALIAPDGQRHPWPRGGWEYRTER